MKFLRLISCHNYLFLRCFHHTALGFLPKLNDVTSEWKIKFLDSEIPEIEESLQLISSHVFNIPDSEVQKYYDSELTKEQVEEFNKCCECRMGRIPIQYILKKWEFRDLTLKMCPPVFIPRPETEMLIDIVSDNATSPSNGLEIGCGSGAISIALLKKFPQLRLKAIDRSKIACMLTSVNAKENLVDNRLEIFNYQIQTNGTVENLKIENWDFIISNPPYVMSSEIRNLQPEIRLYEDLRALDGGADGLQIIKAIIRFSSHVLSDSKSCFIEVHHEHLNPIKRWLEKNSHLNMTLCRSYRDFANYDRFVHLVKRM